LRNLICVIPGRELHPTPLSQLSIQPPTHRSTWASARCVASRRFMFNT
jgi:hypothetical protein